MPSKRLVPAIGKLAVAGDQAMLEPPGNEFDEVIDTQARIQKLNHLFDTESGSLARLRLAC